MRVAAGRIVKPVEVSGQGAPRMSADVRKSEGLQCLARIRVQNAAVDPGARIEQDRAQIGISGEGHVERRRQIAVCLDRQRCGSVARETERVRAERAVLLRHRGPLARA